MLQLLTRENITLALSIFGSIGTLITLVSSYLTTRKNLIIRVTDIVSLGNKETLLLEVIFENHSRIPISISSLSLTVNGEELKPLRYPRHIGQSKFKEGDEVVDRQFIFNLKFPLVLPQLGAESGGILFAVPRKDLETLSTPMIFAVNSTRGQVQRIELQSSQIQYMTILDIP